MGEGVREMGGGGNGGCGGRRVKTKEKRRESRGVYFSFSVYAFGERRG